LNVGKRNTPFGKNGATTGPGAMTIRAPSWFSACDMASALYTSAHAASHRLGASWFEQGACR
jgi:hypothetical protein